MPVERQRLLDVWEVAAKGGGDPYKLYITPELKAIMGDFATEIPRLGDADILLLSARDIVDADQVPGAPLQPVAKSQQNVTTLSGFFNAAGMTATEEMLDGLAYNGINSMPVAFGNDHDHDLKNDTVLIIVPDPTVSAEDHVNLIARLPGMKLRDIPGSAQDYFNLYMLHEAAHANQVYSTDISLSVRTEREAEADRFALEHSSASMNVKEMFVTARLVGSLGHGGMRLDEHNTHPYITADGSLPFLSDTDADLAGMTHVNNLLNCAVHSYHVHERAVQRGAADLKAGFIDLDLPQDKRNSTALFDTVDDPAMNYMILSKLRDKGYFEENTPEREYVDKVISFFDRHVDLDPLDKARLADAANYFSQTPTAQDSAYSIAKLMGAPEYEMEEIDINQSTPRGPGFGG